VGETSLATHRLIPFNNHAYFPQLISESLLDVIGILSLTLNASYFGAGLLKAAFGTKYLFYVLDSDEPLIAKGKWPAKRHLFGKK
jgi:hypothetical protein